MKNETQRADAAQVFPKGCTMNIVLPNDGPPLLRSIELYLDQGRNRTSFTRLRRLDEVFEPGIATRLLAEIKKLTPQARAVSLPDQVFEAKGVVLAGLHLMCTYAKDGTGSLIVRFKKLIGNMQHALREGFGFGEPVAEVADHTALKVLTDISMPLLDICSYAEGEARKEAAGENSHLRALVDRAGEIRFQVELIKRYIDGLERDAPSPQLIEMQPWIADRMLARPN